MIRRKVYPAIILILLTLNFFNFTKTETYASAVKDSVQLAKDYFAIEINGVVCGYMEASESAVIEEEKPLLKQELNMFIMLSLLGSGFNTEMKSISLLEPKTRRSHYSKVDIKQGAINRNFEVKVENNNAVITSSLSSKPKTIAPVPSLASFPSSSFSYPYLSTYKPP